MATTDIYTITGALTPVRKCMRFLGGDVDDGIQIDAAAAAIVAGNHTKGTISAWIMVPDNTGDYAFISFGDSAANVEYFTCAVEAGTIRVMAVVTTPTTQMDVNTAAGTIKPNTWHHVCIVQDASELKIYIDGKDMPLTWTTKTAPGQWFENLNAIDGCHIGCADSEAGGGGLTKEFKGYISYVSIWSGTAAAAALSAAEVTQLASGADATGIQPTYLHNHYDLEFDLADDGTGADTGTLVGEIIYCDANEFACKLTYGAGTMVVADSIHLALNDRMGFALVIQAA